MNEIKKKLQALFVNALRLNLDPEEIGEKDLVARLGIDSISSLEILIWVEDKFNITVEDNDLSPALVDSLDRLAAYIHSRQPVAGD